MVALLTVLGIVLMILTIIRFFCTIEPLIVKGRRRPGSHFKGYFFSRIYRLVPIRSISTKFSTLSQT